MSLSQHQLTAIITDFVERFVRGEGERGLLYQERDGTLLAAILYEVLRGPGYHHLYVKFALSDPTVRGRGFARRLSDRVLHLARGCSIPHVTTCAQDWNEDSLRLIQRFGLRPIEHNLFRSCAEAPPCLPAAVSIDDGDRDLAIAGMSESLRLQGRHCGRDELSRFIGDVLERGGHLLYRRGAFMGLCEPQRTTFKDYLFLHHLALDAAWLGEGLAAMDWLASRVALVELAFAVPAMDHRALKLLLDHDFYLCDTYYSREMS